MSPLRKSRMKQVMPYFLPTMRSTLVAPMFPEPCSRMLMPRDLAMSSPKGIEPSRNASIGSSQIFMLIVVESGKVYVRRKGCQ